MTDGTPSTVAGYRLERVLGRGGMGIVHVAHDERLDRQVALKLIAPELTADGVLRERFLAESRIAASLEHPNVVPVYEAGEANGVLFLAMQLIVGRDLRAALLERGAMTPEVAIPIVTQIASALDAAHSKGLVHRDVKPSNILLTPGPEGDHAYLSDFGLCKPTDSKVEVTSTGQTLGTVDYMAPEQIRGEHADGRADIYALACVTFQCLTGQPPFVGGDLQAMVGHLEQPPPHVRNNPGLDDVIRRALAKHPDERWPTAGEFASALRGATRAGHDAHVVPAVRRHARDGREFARGRSRPAIAMVVAALALAAAAIAGLAWHASLTKTRSAADQMRITSAVPLGDGRTVLAGGHPGLYVIQRTATGGTVSRVDESAGRPGLVTRLKVFPVGIGVGSTQVWMLAVPTLHARSSGLLRLTASGVSTVNVPLRGQPGCVDYSGLVCNPVVGAGSIWVPVGSTVTRLSANGTSIRARYALDDPIAAAVYGRGALWALAGRSLVRIDATDGAVTRIDLGARLVAGVQPYRLTIAGEQIWVACGGADPTRGVLTSVPLSNPAVAIGTTVHYPGVTAIAGDGDVLWVAKSEPGPTLRELDSHTGRPLGQPLKLAGEATWIDVRSTRLWLVTFQPDTGGHDLVSVTTGLPSR